MNNEQNEQPEMPPMTWARRYVCPKGHFWDNVAKRPSFGKVWLASHCTECCKQVGIDVETRNDAFNFIFYGREEWEAGERKVLAIATSINERCLGKDAKCGICNKTIPAKNDKAYHLQKHYSTAITENEAHHIQPV